MEPVEQGHPLADGLDGAESRLNGAATPAARRGGRRGTGRAARDRGEREDGKEDRDERGRRAGRRHGRETTGMGHRFPDMKQRARGPANAPGRPVVPYVRCRKGLPERCVGLVRSRRSVCSYHGPRASRDPTIPRPSRDAEGPRSQFNRPIPRGAGPSHELSADASRAAGGDAIPRSQSIRRIGRHDGGPGSNTAARTGRGVRGTARRSHMTEPNDIVFIEPVEAEPVEARKAAPTAAAARAGSPRPSASASSREPPCWSSSGPPWRWAHRPLRRPRRVRRQFQCRHGAGTNDARQ